jgi:hypothetical protein
MQAQVIAIVSSDGPANVGDLFVFLFPVGGVAVGYRSGLTVAGSTLAKRARVTHDHVLRAHFAEVPGGHRSDR